MPAGSPFPGKYKIALTPYMIELHNNLNPSDPCEIMAVMKAAQIAGSTVGENAILFDVKEDPCKMLYVTATDKLAEKWDVTRLEPMLEGAGVSHLLQSETKKIGKNKTGGKAQNKTYRGGGSIDAISYNRVSSQRMTSYKKAMFDEVDAAKHTVGDEGDPVKNGLARTTAFEGRRKIFILSTPLLTRTSKIRKAFLKGDQRKYNVPCPHCGHLQKLEWRHLKFKTDKYNVVIPGSVYYECQSKDCDEKIYNYHKTEMLEHVSTGGKAEWIPENLHARKNYKSYHISALYAPIGMVTWETLAQEFADAQENREEEQNFVNLRLGETYDDEGGAAAPDWYEVTALRGNYKRSTVPDGVKFVTMACDVQGDRIEAELCGHGEHGRSWSIEYYVFLGKTNDPNSGAFKILKDKWLRRDFIVMPTLILIDSGYNTPIVNEFCRGSSFVFPIMGAGYIKNKLFVEKRLVEYGNVKMFDINTDVYKRALYSRLQLRKDLEGNIPAFYQSFPFDYPDKYFKMLVAEKRIALLTKGQITGYKWVKKSQGAANEALDLRVYNYCALDIFALNVCMMNGIEKLDYRFFWKKCKKNKLVLNPGK
jgi:phage terminase large subunit GpA-like protein